MKTLIGSTRILVIAASVMAALSVAVPSTAEASIWGKIKKTAKKVVHKAESTTKSALEKAEDIGKDVGDVVLDEGIDIGKSVKKEGTKETFELREKGKVVGNIVVENGKIIETDTIENGKLVGKEIEKGPKYLVKGTEIVGQEVVHDGKVIGNTVIKDGKVVGMAAVAGGEYIVKEGRIALKFISAQACLALLTTLKDVKKIGSALPDFNAVVDEVKSKTHTKKAFMVAQKGANQTAKVINAQLTKVGDMVPELQRVGDTMKSSKSAIEGIFTANTICNSSAKDLEAKLVAQKVKPTLVASSGLGSFFINEANAAAKGFFMAYSVNAQAAAGIGVVTSITVATNYKGETGVFFSVGPQEVTNVTASGGIGLQFYPNVELSSFEGWGYGLGGSFDLPIPKAKGVAGGGIEISMDQNLTTVQGFGISLSAGKGESPVDLGINATYTWKLK